MLGFLPASPMVSPIVSKSFLISSLSSTVKIKVIFFSFLFNTVVQSCTPNIQFDLAPATVALFFSHLAISCFFSLHCSSHNLYVLSMVEKREKENDGCGREKELLLNKKRLKSN